MQIRTAADHGVVSTIFRPLGALAGIVDAIWDLEIPDAAVARGIMMQILPSASPILCFHSLSATSCGTLPGTVQNRQRATWILTRALSFRPAGPMRSVIVGLKPESAFRLMRADMGDFADTAVPLGDVLPTAAISELEDKLGSMADAAARAVAVQTVILRALRPVEPDRLVRQAEIWLRADPAMSVATLAAKLDVSPRHLQRHFLAVTGATPKHFARIMRLDRVIAAARPGQIDWASVAHSCGFTDQAHLINDFHTLTGQSPDAFFRGHTPAYRRLNGVLAASRFHNTFVGAAAA